MHNIFSILILAHPHDTTMCRLHLTNDDDQVKLIFIISSVASFLGILPEALRTSCRKCTSTQKSKAMKAITNLYYAHPNIYIALAEKYDSTGDYTRRFENWFDERNAVNELVNDSSKDVKVLADSPVTDASADTSGESKSKHAKISHTRSYFRSICFR